MLFFILPAKVILGTILDNMTQKHYSRHVLAKYLLEIELPWQKLRSQVIKNYQKLCATC